MAVHHRIFGLLLKERRDLNDIPEDDYWIAMSIVYWKDDACQRTNIESFLKKPSDMTLKQFKQTASLRSLMDDSEKKVQLKPHFATGIIEDVKILYCIPLRAAVEMARDRLDKPPPYE
jgi:hypothetical protein